MSAESATANNFKFVEQIREEKPFHYIVQNLESTFGEPKLAPKSDALAMLINIVLYLWIAGGNLGMFPVALVNCYAVCRRRLHRRCLLVYRLYFVCQSGGHAGAFNERYVRRYSPG